MTPPSLMIALCGLCLFASALRAADDNADLAAVRAQVAKALDQPSLVVSGTVVTLNNGKPMTTTTFTGRCRKPAHWLITWQDTGGGGYRSGGTAWGDGAQSHLQFSGSTVVQTTADADMTIAAATGISHRLAPWLYGLFRGQPQNILAEYGTVSQVDGNTLVTVAEQPGDRECITVSKGLITGAETINDLGKAGPVALPKLDDAQLSKIIEGQGDKPTPEKLAELRAMLDHARDSMAKSTAVFTATYVFNWQLDHSVGDAELLPEPAQPEPAQPGQQ